MTTSAVLAGGLLIFPMTVEARVMTMRGRLEKLVRLCRRVGLWRERGDDQVVIPLMTNRAVVVIGFLILGHREGRTDDRS